MNDMIKELGLEECFTDDVLCNDNTNMAEKLYNLDKRINESVQENRIGLYRSIPMYISDKNKRKEVC